LFSDDGWDFSMVIHSGKIFEDKVSLRNDTNYQPELKWNKKG